MSPGWQTGFERKPLATTVEDAVARAGGRVALGQRLVSVGLMRRFDPQHMAAKAAVADGAWAATLLFKGIHRNAAAPYGITGKRS